MRFLCGLMAVALAQASGGDASIAQLLAARFTDPGLSYLLLDARTGETIAAKWNSIDQPIPMGSLVKPFTALAYAASHPNGYPEFTCTGARCWLPKGHGRVGIGKAVAYSCNAYFLMLAGKTVAAGVFANFGLPEMPQDAPPTTRIGSTPLWKCAPSQLVRAYIELLARRTEPAVKPLINGMRQSAAFGTASAVSVPAIAKTGTAACSHIPKSAGDGFVLAIFPPESPQYALLVRMDGAPGAVAARPAGAMVRAILAGR